jgi:DNA processing protein
MVGMSHAVLVIEATEKSGTLITARLAAEYNRELGVVPGSIFAPGSAGPHQFLTLGATPIYNAASLRELLGLREAPTLPYSTTTQTTPSLPTHAVQILETLVEPLTVSAIQAQTKLETSTLQAALTLLEIQGYVTRAHGRIQRHQLPT